ncbi:MULTISPECIES: RagB/SusD family nutrient uptake outer membrane protein [Aestuariivivens]|uniref:RagB/SusD family nutrient uptake outer membrane protein n=1 Tax=Aestuariivivens TaxID=1820275 RepID=UPI001CBCB842|nr:MULTISPECIES: RagB/SusD family nutrient uptake outer membrane protein [Aestuariivivens]
MERFKHKIKNTVLGALIIFSIAGCNDDFFDTQPDNLLSIESIFENRQQTERWWAGLFSSIQDIWAYPYNYQYGLMCDEMDASNWTNPSINSGAISADSYYFGFTGHYEKIRLATIFLENIDNNDEILALNNGPEIIRQYKGEAQFLRAYNYWVMMKHLGPVVIQPLEVGSPDGDYQIPRSTWSECIDFVLSEMAQAKEKLPVDYFQSGTAVVDGTQVGRINKMIVEAVESQILLYNASPLFNGNTELADFKNLDGTQLIPQTYDANKWTLAANAAKEAIDLAEANGKGLYQASGADAFTTAYNSVKNLYWDGWDVEGIWLRPSTGSYNWEIHCAPRSTQNTGYNGLAVVQRLVDDFRMSDGESIEDSQTYTETGYSGSSTPYYAAGTNNMYVDREPRFYAWINFNGAVHPSIPRAGQPYVEFYNTGNSGKNGAPRDWPKTGYTVRKNTHPAFRSDQGTFGRPAMLIRLAELYLNYAEALNEADPGNSNILIYLNKVRVRAGLPELSAGMSQDEMRDQIRLERRVEFCFEAGHRFFDVRRWKIADKSDSYQGGVYYGMNMNEGTELSSDEFHTRVPAFTRTQWQRRYYFFPYGQNEMDRNKQLVQFPGY